MTIEQIKLDLENLRFFGEYGFCEGLPGDYVDKIAEYIFKLLAEQKGE